MNTTRRILCLILMLGLVVALSCAPQAAPVPAAAPQSPAPAAAPAAAVPSAVTAAKQPTWQDKWENLLAAAKKEGEVVIYTGGGATTRTALIKIAATQGMKGEVISVRSEEFLVRANAERRVGLYLTDLYVGGFNMMLTEAKPAGMVQKIDPALILPDLTNPELVKKAWYKGELPWVDKDHTVMVATLTPQSPVVINTNMVNESEIKSWRDLLNPKWKGKIIINDPTVSGAGNMGLACIDGIMGWDYIKELAKMEPIVMRDQRQQLEWLAHGKAAILTPPKPDALRDFLKLGVPIKALVPSEGAWVSAGSSGIAFISKEPHPNAARAFINMLLSLEGQTIITREVGSQSSREDAPTAHLQPQDIRKEGVKYFNGYSEDFNAGPRRAEVNKLAKELFTPLIGKVN